MDTVDRKAQFNPTRPDRAKRKFCFFCQRTKKRKKIQSHNFLSRFFPTAVCTLPSSFLRAAKSKRHQHAKNTRQKIFPPLVLRRKFYAHLLSFLKKSDQIHKPFFVQNFNYSNSVMFIALLVKIKRKMFLFLPSNKLQIKENQFWVNIQTKNSPLVLLFCSFF